MEQFHSISVDEFEDMDFVHFPDGELPDLQMRVKLLVSDQPEHGGVVYFIDVDTGDIVSKEDFGPDEGRSMYAVIEDELYKLRQDYIVEAYREYRK